MLLQLWLCTRAYMVARTKSVYLFCLLSLPFAARSSCGNVR